MRTPLRGLSLPNFSLNAIRAGISFSAISISFLPKTAKFISATLATQLIYDDDIKVLRTTGDKAGSFGPDVQFKQVLGVGFTYKF